MEGVSQLGCGVTDRLDYTSAVHPSQLFPPTLLHWLAETIRSSDPPAVPLAAGTAALRRSAAVPAAFRSIHHAASSCPCRDYPLSYRLRSACGGCTAENRARRSSARCLFSPASEAHRRCRPGRHPNARRLGKEAAG